MKKCLICGEVKPYSEFHKQADRKDGYCNWCKKCKSLKKAKEYKNNREHVLSRVAKYRNENPGKARIAKQRSYNKKKKYYQEMHKDYYEKNKEAIFEKQREYRTINKEKILERNREYKKLNRTLLNSKQSEYQKQNWPRLKKYYRSYWKKRIKNDPICALKFLLRRRTLAVFSGKGYKKTSKTQQLLGCGYEYLMQHIESQFVEGMTWRNRGLWHIDHIVPLASADTKEELMALCHYTNLQPLWAKDNLSKGARAV